MLFRSRGIDRERQREMEREGERDREMPKMVGPMGGKKKLIP